jgi:ABC-type uncharacterized transport system permease subunit
MILLYVPVAAAYLAAAWFEWRALGVSADGAVLAGANWLAPLAIAGHAALLAHTLFTAGGLDLSLANALSVVQWIIALVAWLGTRARTLPGVAAIAFPVAAIGAALPSLAPSMHRISFAGEPWAALHIAIAFVAYALLIVAALQALVLTGLERRLHRGLADERSPSMPPLLTLERFLFRLVAAGYVLLTLTLISGALFSEQLFGKPFSVNSKTVFSVLSWLVFGALLYGRRRYGWRGRTALNWILAGSALLLIAYIGTKLVGDSGIA